MRYHPALAWVLLRYEDQAAIKYRQEEQCQNKINPIGMGFCPCRPFQVVLHLYDPDDGPDTQGKAQANHNIDIWQVQFDQSFNESIHGWDYDSIGEPVNQVKNHMKEDQAGKNHVKMDA